MDDGGEDIGDFGLCLESITPALPVYCEVAPSGRREESADVPMSRQEYKGPSPWENRYERPDVAALLSAFDAIGRQLIQSARTALSGLEGVSETIAWQGIPWRWCFVYALRGERRALAYLVPQPGRVYLAVPLTAEIVESIRPRRLSRATRDAIVHAPVVGGVRWVQWDLTGRAVLEEVVGLVELRQAGTLQGA